MLAIGLFWLGVILVVVALLMLFCDSFKHRKVWALISLILIVPLIVHMFINWSTLNSRKAFYLVILGILSIAVSIAGGVLTKLPFLPEHEVVQVLEENIAPPKQAPLPNQEQADAAAQSIEENYDPLLTGSEYEALDAKEIVPEDINKNNPNAAGARYQSVTLDERVQAINKWIRLKMSDGRIIEGRLTDVLEDGVLIESNVNGGSLGLSYRNDEIADMSVRLESGEQLLKQVPQDDVEQSATEIEQNQDEIINEEISPEARVLEDTSVQETTDEVLEKVETIVDDTRISNSKISDTKISEEIQ